MRALEGWWEVMLMAFGNINFHNFVSMLTLPSTQNIFRCKNQSPENNQSTLPQPEYFPVIDKFEFESICVPCVGDCSKKKGSSSVSIKVRKRLQKTRSVFWTDFSFLINLICWYIIAYLRTIHNFLLHASTVQIFFSLPHSLTPAPPHFPSPISSSYPAPPRCLLNIFQQQ